jgi:hypothetical protein
MNWKRGWMCAHRDWGQLISDDRSNGRTFENQQKELLKSGAAEIHVLIKIPGEEPCEV